MMEVDLQTMLKTNGTLTAVAMTFATDPQSIPLPKITFQKVGEVRYTSNAGDVGNAVVGIQINCVATTLTQAKTLARAVKTTMVAGMGGTFGSTQFGSIVLEAEKDADAPVEGGVEKPTQTCIQSWRISFCDNL